MPNDEEITGRRKKRSGQFRKKAGQQKCEHAANFLRHSKQRSPEAAKNQFTLAELAKKFDVNPVVISKWKAEFLENMAAAFERPGSVSEEGSVDPHELYARIGQLRVENEFLKKSCRKLGI